MRRSGANGRYETIRDEPLQEDVIRAILHAGRRVQSSKNTPTLAPLAPLGLQVQPNEGLSTLQAFITNRDWPGSYQAPMRRTRMTIGQSCPAEQLFTKGPRGIFK